MALFTILENKIKGIGNLLFLSFFLVSCTSPESIKTPQENTDSLLKLVSSYYEISDFETCEIILDYQWSTAKTISDTCRYWLARVEYEKNNYERALQLLRGLKNHTGEHVIHYKALTFSKLKLEDSACFYFRQLVTINDSFYRNSYKEMECADFD